MERVFFSNKKILIFLFSLLNAGFIYSQTENKKFEPSGKITGQIFLNYHYDYTEGALKKSQFEILRSNLGYVYNFSEKLTGKVVFDASNDGKAYSAYVKGASLEWRETKFTFEGGMMKTFLFDTQEDFWGYRYIMESMQDKEKFYSSYDLGLKAAYKPSDFIQFRVGVYNGEGFKKLQDDFGRQRGSFDVIIHPVKEITLKAYFDYMPKKDTAIHDPNMLFRQSTRSFFAGYEKSGKFRVGAEYNIQNGNGNRKSYNLNALSCYGTYVIKAFEVFGRYDKLMSNTFQGESESWNIGKDYQMITGGIQAMPVKGIKTSLNYRHYIPEKSNAVPGDLLYLNLELRF